MSKEILQSVAPCMQTAKRSTVLLARHSSPLIGRISLFLSLPLGTLDTFAIQAKIDEIGKQ